MKTKKICNVAINDVKESVGITSTKAYICWANMINRCYNLKAQSKYKSFQCYTGHTVCEEWLKFSNFKKWHDANYHEGYELDKDIVCKNNTVYSPETCIMIPEHFNLILGKSYKESKYKHPGVSWNKKVQKYVVHVTIKGEIKHFGYFDDVIDAFLEYKSIKEAYIREVANHYYAHGLITDLAYQSLLNVNYTYTIQ